MAQNLDLNSGPIQEQGRAVDITNYEAGKQRLALEMLPKFMFPENNTFLINDLEATCYGIMDYQAENKLGMLFETLFG